MYPHSKGRSSLQTMAVALTIDGAFVCRMICFFGVAPRPILRSVVIFGFHVQARARAGLILVRGAISKASCCMVHRASAVVRTGNGKGTKEGIVTGREAQSRPLLSSMTGLPNYNGWSTWIVLARGFPGQGGHTPPPTACGFGLCFRGLSGPPIHSKCADENAEAGVHIPTAQQSRVTEDDKTRRGNSSVH